MLQDGEHSLNVFCVKAYICCFNLFPTINPDEIRLRVQRQITRFYLFILLTMLIIVFLCIILPFHTEIVSEYSPSLIEYQHLYNCPNLQCSCSSVAISYSSFLSLTLPTYHQICSSDFISQKWISLMFAPSIDQYLADTTYQGSSHYNLTQYSVTDYRTIATYHFQLLATFCQLSNSTIVAALEQLSTQ
ncbi:hypothetical protein I4U23_027947 [Adineta vaga]|nr:hypothetical protein I4U23_027947 [Adineta vaga]